MARGRASFTKRERERQQSERAAMKRERRAEREADGARVATREELDGYGLGPTDDDEEPEAIPPRWQS